MDGQTCVEELAVLRADELGDLTLSMLKGEHGYQRKEIDKLVSWLAREVRPEIINLTNALLAGMVPQLKERLGVPILCTLQGDDIFLESLPESYRKECLELIRGHCRAIDGFIATSDYYADGLVPDGDCRGYYIVLRVDH